MRKRQPITGLVKDLYISAIMNICILTNEKSEVLEVSKDKDLIKDTLAQAQQKAIEKIDKYNQCIEQHLPICEDLAELFDFADEYIQSKQLSDTQKAEEQTETV